MSKTKDEIIKELKQTIKDRNKAIKRKDNDYTNMLREMTIHITQKMLLTEDLISRNKKIKELEGENATLERQLYELEEENREIYDKLQRRIIDEQTEN